MEDDGKFQIFGPFPKRAGGREDDEVHGSAIRGDGKNAQICFACGEIIEEPAARPHLFRAFTRIKPSGVGAMVGCGNGDESITTFCSIQGLEIVAANQATHAEGDNADGLLGAKGGIDIVLKLQGEFFQSAAAITGL